MEKLEWREAFNRQPIHYLFFDFSVAMPIDTVSTICQVLQNLTALSNSLKGSSRFTMLAVYVLSRRSRCIFPLQSVKYNYMKLQVSLDSMQASQAVSLKTDTYESDDLAEILADSVKQYETYFQNATVNSDEWPQIQMMCFSSQSSQNVTQLMKKALPSVHLAYISKVHMVVLKGRRLPLSSSSSQSKTDARLESSPVLFGNETDTDEMISSLIQVTEIEANAYQIESIIKQWLHDYSTDSDHLRLTMGSLTVRCDIKECTLNTDALPVSGQFHLLPEGSSASQHVGRATPSSKQTSASKVPVYEMDAFAVVQKEGLCESLLFGHGYFATATRCWKIDWDELDRNQQLFLAIARSLDDRGQVLIAKKKTAQIMPSEKVLPTAYFALIPAKNKLLIKSLAPGELILPSDETLEKDIPHEVTMEARACLANLVQKAVYNPLTMTSGLYSYLTTSQIKKTKPTTSFVAPIMSRNEDQVKGKKTRKVSGISALEVNSSRIKTEIRTDFMTASAMLKRKFPQEFD